MLAIIHHSHYNLVTCTAMGKFGKTGYTPNSTFRLTNELEHSQLPMLTTNASTKDNFQTVYTIA